MPSWADLDLNQPINWAHPLNRGRVAWWLARPLVYGTNDWPDLVQGYNGVLASFTSGLGWNSASYPGGAGSIIGTAASSCKVTIATSPALRPALPFTLALWFKTVTTANQVVFECNGLSGFSVEMSNNVHGAIVCACSSGSKGVQSSILVNDGKWHSAVFSLSLNGGSVYIDGSNLTTLVGTGAGNPTYSTAPYYFFSRNGSFGFDGSLNDVSVWNRALSQQEITALYWYAQQGYPDVLNYEEPSPATIFLPPPPASTWTFKQSASTSTSLAASLSLAYPSAVTQGDLLVATALVAGGTPTSMTVADNQGNTWTQAVVSAKNTSDSGFLAIWYTIANGNNTPTVTVTPNTGSPSFALAVAEFSPGSPATSYTITLDGTASAVSTVRTNAPSAGNVPVSNAGELVIAGCGGHDSALSSAMSAGTGFTLDQSIISSPMLGTEYDLSASSAIAGAFTWPQTRFWEAVGASFSSSGSSSVLALLRNFVSRYRFEPAYFE